MEANMIDQNEFCSIAYLNKKRKLEDELLSLPSSKHVCWDQRLVCDFPSYSTIEPNTVRSSILARGVESGPDSASSYSFLGDDDCPMASHDDAKTYISYPKAHETSGLGSSSSFSADISSKMCLYSLESRSLTKESSSKVESPSVCEDLHCLYRQYGLQLSDNYGVRVLEIGSHADCSFAEYQNEVIEGCVDEDVNNHLYSNEAPDSNYVLSSGRWSVNQDNQEGTKKPTIDQEFEQYFSALML